MEQLRAELEGALVRYSENLTDITSTHLKALKTEDALLGELLNYFSQEAEEHGDSTNTMDQKDGQQERKQEKEPGETEGQSIMSEPNQDQLSFRERFLLENQESPETARRLADRLYNLSGFQRSEVLQHLCPNTDFGRMVTKEYLAQFKFEGVRLDEAFRSFITACWPAGETCDQERVLQYFSQRYHQCNPTALASEDAVYLLTCAMMMLNSDLHNRSIRVKMTCQHFVANLRKVEDHDFPEELCRQIYHSIKKKKLEWLHDDTKASGKRTNIFQRFFSALFSRKVEDQKPIVKKMGFLYQREDNIKNGNSDSESWELYHAISINNCLVLQKEEYDPKRGVCKEDMKNAINLHGAMFCWPLVSNEWPHVFSVLTVDCRLLYFQAESKQEMMSWFEALNPTGESPEQQLQS